MFYEYNTLRVACSVYSDAMEHMFRGQRTCVMTVERVLCLPTMFYSPTTCYCQSYRIESKHACMCVCMQECMHVCMSEVWGLCVVLWTCPPTGKSFRFVRACERARRSCVSAWERLCFCRWASGFRILLRFRFASFLRSVPRMASCYMHGFFQFPEILDDMCMGLMHFRRFINVLLGFSQIYNDLLMYHMGLLKLPWFVNVLYGFS